MIFLMGPGIDAPKKFKKKSKRKTESVYYTIGALLAEGLVKQTNKAKKRLYYRAKGTLNTDVTLGQTVAARKAEKHGQNKERGSSPSAATVRAGREKEKVAEAQSFSKTQTDAQKAALKPLNPKPKRAKTPSLAAGGNTTTGANAAGDEGVPVGNDANKKSQELQQQNIKTRSMYEKEDTLMNKEKKKDQLDEILGTIVKGITRVTKKIKDTVAPEEDDPTMKKPGRRLRDAEKSLETQSTQYNNAYVRKLMEMDGPTKEELKAIEKEKPAKIPKKKYFGGQTNPNQVDTEAAIASHKKGIRAAGEATKKREDQSTAYHRIGKIIAETEFPKGPTAKKYAGLGRAKDTKGGTAAIKDPLVKREVAKTKANIDKKTQSDTNPNVSDLVQGSMNRRRGAGAAVSTRRKGKKPAGSIDNMNPNN